MGDEDASERPQVADVGELCLETGRRFRSRTAGIFLFLPFLAQIKFHQLVDTADYPGTKMIPAANALLSLLALKLLHKERLSHIDDFNCDEALGLFAGLNVPPKKSFATDYSYRTQRSHQEQLLKGWIGQLSPLLFPEADSFSLDFHAIPHRGEETDLENHYLPTRGHAGPSVLTFFAQEQKSRVLCYANANLIRQHQAAEIMKFVEFWHDLTGKDPQWLYFDSKLTSYEELSRLNARSIYFVTIRRRGSSIVRRLEAVTNRDWHTATIDIPKRRHKKIWYLDERVSLKGYEGEIRQISVKGLGREHPTLFLSNHFERSPREMIVNYARRNGIEDALGTSVNFFHLDCLSSEVRLNVDLDTVLTVLANGCYRWLAHQLLGYEKAKPKQLCRKFVETAGKVEIQSGRRIVVHFERRSHNPVLREARLDRESLKIPWLGNHRVEFMYT
jgi:hypothetical protein